MSLWSKESIKNTLNLHIASTSIHSSSKLFLGETADPVAVVLMPSQCLLYFWRQKCRVNFHSNTNDEVQGRNEASRRALCTNTSKQFICWLLKASCVCFAVCMLTRSAALVYSTRLPSHSSPMFHHKTLFQKCVLTLKLNMMLDFYLKGGRGEWFSVCQGLKITLAWRASALWF